MNTPQRRLFASSRLAFVFALAAASLSAQTAPSASAPPAGSAGGSSGDVVILSPFEVVSNRQHGYAASEAVTGTRIATNIAETPFAVDVVTSDFIGDFMAFGLNEQLAFVPGFSPSEVFGQFQLRGFSSPVVFVDGFRRVGFVDTVDIDRIEIVKGPAASIYGATLPGGAVNYITRQPSTTPTEDLVVGGGGDDFFRASLFSSGPVGDSGKWFYRIDVADQFNKYGEDFSSREQSYLSAKLLYKPSEATSITVEAERGDLYEHPFNQVLTVTEKQTMPWAGNSITESQYYGMATTSLLDYDYGGPESYDRNRMNSATLMAEHRFNNHWSMKLGMNMFSNPYMDQLIGSGAYYPYGTGNVTVANGVVTNPFTPEVKDQPQADWKPQRGGGVQLDNLFTFQTGPIANKLLVTADYYEVSQRLITLIPTVNGSQATDYYATYSPYSSAGASYYAMQSTWSPTLGYGWNTTTYNQNAALYNAVTSDNWTASGDAGLFASEWATLFHDHLVLMAGGRYDNVKNQVKNYNIPATGTASSLVLAEPTSYQAFDYSTSAWTYQLGASLKVVNGLSLYANKSTAFNPQPQLDSYTGLALPNNKANGYEFGLKATLLDGRFNLTADRFLIDEFNVVQSETDPVTGQKDTILSGEQQAKGYETQFTYQVTAGLQFLGDWGYTETKILNSDTLTFLNGLPTRRVPRDNAGLAARYEITHGKLRGLYLLGAVRYFSKSLVNLGSGKSLIPGPAGTTVGATSNMYYVPAKNLTYLSDPKATGEVKLTATPVINVPFPVNGLLPYPNLPANALVNYPVDANGNPLPLSSKGVYVGEPTGVFVDDGRLNNFNAPASVVTVGTGYTWKTGRVSHLLRVDVSNLLNRQYTWGSGVPGMPLQILATYNLHF